MNEDNEIHRTLGRIEGKLDAQSAAQTARQNVEDAANKKRDERIGSLETRINRVSAIAGFLAFIAALIIKPVSDWLIKGS